MSTEHNPARRQIRVLLDSNALFIPLQFRLDIFEELKTLLEANIEPVLLSPVLKELRILAVEGTPKIRKDASFALELAKNCKTTDFHDVFAMSADDAIVHVADMWKCPVLTNDVNLRKRLRDINVPVIYVRQKSRLEIDGGYHSCLNS